MRRHRQDHEKLFQLWHDDKIAYQEWIESWKHRLDEAEESDTDTTLLPLPPHDPIQQSADRADCAISTKRARRGRGRAFHCKFAKTCISWSDIVIELD